MRIPRSWLAEHVDVADISNDELVEILTLGGLEVERVETADVRGVVVAEVRDIAKVEGSDKLHLVRVFDGDTERTIVCGADNYAVGNRVPAALPGAVLPGGFDIGRRTMFGHTSDGMLASARELGVGDDHRGIWILDDAAPVGADIADYVGLNDPVVVLEITPDRGYALSIVGVARDLSALTGAAFISPLGAPAGMPAVTGPPSTPIPVTIVDTDRCPRFTGHTLTGVRPGVSPPWLQHRLAAAGMRAVSNVVDITNYVMLELGNPIHAYDRAKLSGPEIIVRTARMGERVITLDGVDRELDPDDLLICDGAGPVGLAGVMGGHTTEISDSTSQVYVEVANFSARTVLRTARRHGLRTEGAVRWERQVPPETAVIAARRCAELLSLHTGAQVTSVSDTYPAPPAETVVTLHTATVRSHLGAPIDDREQQALLERISCVVEPDAAHAAANPDGISGIVYAVRPPYWRPDLRIPVDLHEEIVRLYGYDRLPATLPTTGEPGSYEPTYRARRAIRHTLAGGGWTEALTFPFIASDDVRRLGLAPDDRRQVVLPLVNPLSQEESVLRTSMLPGLLRAARRSVGRGVADTSLFEIGRVFLAPTAQDPGYDGGPYKITLPTEPAMLGLIASGVFAGERHDASGRAVDIFDLFGAIDLVRCVLGLLPLDVAATEEAPYHPGRAATLSMGELALGTAGELHPRICDEWGVPRRTVAAEIRLDALIADGVPPPIGEAPSPLPGLRFDVAIVVPDDVGAARVQGAVREGAGERLTGLTLFDEYRGDPLPERHKSLAWRVALDDPETQLSDKDEAAAIDAIEASVRSVGGELRRS